jgi:hypothetical protein
MRCMIFNDIGIGDRRLSSITSKTSMIFGDRQVLGCITRSMVVWLDRHVQDQYQYDILFSQPEEGSYPVMPDHLLYLLM